MAKQVKLITDEKAEIEKELKSLARIISDKTLELNALRSAYAEKRKRAEIIDRSRALVDGRRKVLEPKTSAKKTGKSRTTTKIIDLSRGKLSLLINELEKLQDEKEKEQS